MCDLIPKSVEGLNTAKTGWHQRCYQRFVKNLDQLKPAGESSHPTSPELYSAPATSHSPRKHAPKRSLKKPPFLLQSDKCLFCDKKTIKKQDKKKSLTKTFSDWSHKSSGWEKIERMAKEMQNEGNNSLLCKVAGVGYTLSKCPDEMCSGGFPDHKFCYNFLPGPKTCYSGK